MNGLPPLLFNDGASVRRLRIRLGLSQEAFWSRLGVTRSGGSRYENGNRPMPYDVRVVLNMAHAPAPLPAEILAALRSR